MPATIECLESRTLFSAVPPAAATVVADQAALGAATKAALVHQATCARMLAGDLKAIKAGLKQLKANPQNAALLKTITADYKSCQNILKADLRAAVNSSSRDVKRATADLIKLLRKPTNAALQSKFAADLVQLQGTSASTLAAKIVSDASECETTLGNDLAAIRNANPDDLGLNQDAIIAQDDVTDCMGMAQNDSDAILAAVQKLATDAAAAATG